MNWLGLSTRLALAMLASTILSAVILHFGYANGVELPWLAGVLVGAATMVFADKPNVMVGLLAGTIAVWVSATSQVVSVGRVASPIDVARGLVHFSSTLDAKRWLNFGACALAAILLGVRALPRRASPATV